MNFDTHLDLDTKQTSEMADRLNQLLANYEVFYINTRGYHWNIKGEQFFELHEKFEELYDELYEKIDAIAERILTLGGRPLHSYTAYLQAAVIKESTDKTNGKEIAEEIAASLKLLIEQQRELLILSDKADDEGTNALMSDYISEQEKTLWMYNAYLGR